MLERQIGELLNGTEIAASPTELDRLADFYVLAARADGNSDSTIATTLSALRTLQRFLRENGLSTDAALIRPHEMRRFILYLRSLPRFSHHPCAHQQDSCLSGSYSELLLAGHTRGLQSLGK